MWRDCPNPFHLFRIQWSSGRGFFFLSYLDEKLVWWIFFYNSLPFVVINSVDHLWHVRLFLLNLPPLFLQHHRMNFIVFIVLFERKLIVFCVSVCLGSHTHPNMVGMYIWEAISLHMAENFSPNCGINSPTKVIYSWVLTVVRVHGTNDFFHYFNLKKKKQLLQKNLAMYGFH